MENLGTWTSFAVFLLFLILTLGVGFGMISGRSIRTPLERSFLLYLLLVNTWNFLNMAPQIPFGHNIQIIIVRLAAPAWIFFGYASSLLSGMLLDPRLIA